jgi:hypothetical protein
MLKAAHGFSKALACVWTRTLLAMRFIAACVIAVPFTVTTYTVSGIVFTLRSAARYHNTLALVGVSLAFAAAALAAGHHVYTGAVRHAAVKAEAEATALLAAQAAQAAAFEAKAAARTALAAAKEAEAAVSTAGLMGSMSMYVGVGCGLLLTMHVRRAIKSSFL